VGEEERGGGRGGGGSFFRVCLTMHVSGAPSLGFLGIALF